VAFVEMPTAIYKTSMDGGTTLIKTFDGEGPFGKAGMVMAHAVDETNSVLEGEEVGMKGVELSEREEEWIEDYEEEYFTEEYECSIEGCERTFDTDKGRKIHESQCDEAEEENEDSTTDDDGVGEEGESSLFEDEVEDGDMEEKKDSEEEEEEVDDMANPEYEESDREESR
jgi:hypothetical protein